MAGEMFDIVPFLRGRHLYYSEYMTGTAFLIFFLGFLIFKFLSYLVRPVNIQKLKVEDSVYLLSRQAENEQSFQHQLRESISIILKAISFIFLQLFLVPFAMFRFISMWIAMVWGLSMTLFSLRSIGKQLYSNNSIKIAPMKQFREKNPHLFTTLMIIFILSAIVFPILLTNTCLCFYQSSPNLIQLKGTGAAINTWFMRYIKNEEWCQNDDEICHIYTTIPDDGTTQIFVNVHTSINIQKIELQVINQQNIDVTYELFEYDDLESLGDRNHHVFLLKNLTPDSEYELKIIWENIERGSYRIRSLPQQASKSRPLKYISGGDAGNVGAALNLWNMIPQFDPDFISIGGDIAYDNNIIDCYWTWDWLLTNYQNICKSMGRLVPLIMTIGNHDIGLNGLPRRKVILKDGQALPIYFSYFPQQLNKVGGIPKVSERSSYHLHEFSGIQFFSLDSGYAAEYGGEQGKFIDDNVKGDLMKMAIYHVPLYNSCDVIANDLSYVNFGMFEWIPRFDQYQFKVVYENHVHTFKRTKILKGNREDPSGTLYLGDGNWGAKEMKCNQSPFSYIEKMEHTNSYWVAIYDGQNLTNRAINDSGNEFDSVTYP